MTKKELQSQNTSLLDKEILERFKDFKNTISTTTKDEVFRCVNNFHITINYMLFSGLLSLENSNFLEEILNKEYQVFLKLYKSKERRD